MDRDWNENVLIATVGTAPGIVTETVWALLERKPIPWCPTHIYLVTTSVGARACESALLGERSQLAALFRSRGLVPVEPQPRIPTIPTKQPIEDIRTREENVAFANEITRLIKLHAERPDSRIHVSIAGGRKTMSSYAQAALSIFGRDQDELTHVLISIPEFEYSPLFFYPEQAHQPIPIKIKDEATQAMITVERNAREATIDLVPSPFIRMGYILREDAFPGGVVDYERTIEQVQAGLEEDRIKLKTGSNELVVGRTVSLTLPPRAFAFYRLLAQARKERWSGAGPAGFGRGQEGWLTYSLLCTPREDGSTPLKLFCDYWIESAAVSERDDSFNDRATAAKVSAGELQDLAARGSSKRVKQRFRDIKNDTRNDIAVGIANINKRDFADIREVSERRGGRGRAPDSDISRFGLYPEPAQIRIE